MISRVPSHEWCPARLRRVTATPSATIDPDPPEGVREAILAALAPPVAAGHEGWAAAALLEGVEDGELDP